MIAIPALDLRGGACVQLVGGDDGAERIRLSDPLEVAREWLRVGFTRLHLVDLDAATGRGSNAELVREIIRNSNAEIQVGGGLRRREDVEQLFDEGATRVIIGTRAIEEPEWFAALAELFPGQIIVSTDVRDRRIVTRGWTRTLTRNVMDVIEELNDLPIAGTLVTAVHREGRLEGTDLFLMEDVADISDHPVMAAGGISTLTELRALDDRGIWGAVVGMALYTGSLNATQVADEFGSEQ